MLTLPTIHLNGTNPEELRRGYAEARTHALLLVEKLLATAPNGRDYYLQGDEAIKQATREHWARIAKINAILEELEALDAHVDAQVAERAALRGRG